MTNIIRRYATGMNGTKWMLLFFAPFYQISRTDDRTKANISERKRIAIVHAKFALTENRHYFAHLPHNGFGDALLARNYCAYNGMAFRTSDNVYNCVIMTRHYCAFGDADFTARYCAFSDTNLSCSYCRYNGAWFCALDMRYVVASFGIPLYRQSWRAILGALCRVLWLAFCVRHMCFKPGAFMPRYSRYKAGSFNHAVIAHLDGGIFRAIISMILIFTCNQVNFI